MRAPSPCTGAPGSEPAGPTLAAAAPACKTDFAMERAAAALNALANLVIWLRAPHCGLAEHAQHAALTGTGVLLAVLSLWPDNYSRQRLVLIPAVRFLLMSMPIARSATDFSASVLLSAPPTPGLLGAVRDALRYGNGANLIGQCLITLLFPLPLPLSVVTHVGVLWLTSHATGFCDTPMLSHPLSRARITQLASALDLAVVIPSVTFSTGDIITGRRGPLTPPADPLQDCRHVLLFGQALTALIPLLIQAWLTAAPQQPAATAGDHPPGRAGGVKGVAVRAWQHVHVWLRCAAAAYAGVAVRFFYVFAFLIPLLWFAARHC